MGLLPKHLLTDLETAVPENRIKEIRENKFEKEGTLQPVFNPGELMRMFGESARARREGELQKIFLGAQQQQQQQQSAFANAGILGMGIVNQFLT